MSIKKKTKKNPLKYIYWILRFLFNLNIIIHIPVEIFPDDSLLRFRTIIKSYLKNIASLSFLSGGSKWGKNATSWTLREGKAGGLKDIPLNKLIQLLQPSRASWICRRRTFVIEYNQGEGGTWKLNLHSSTQSPNSRFFQFAVTDSLLGISLKFTSQDTFFLKNRD